MVAAAAGGGGGGVTSGGGGFGGGGGGPAQDPGAPEFSEGSRAIRSVGEHTEPGTDIGGPLTAVDPDGDPLTYTLGGTHADLFDLDTSTGQLLTKSALDYETRNSYTLSVSVRDSKDPEGEPDRRRDDSIRVTILVTNQDDPGVITPSAPTPRVDEPFSAALADPDGGVTDLAWQWDRSPDKATWTPIDGATTNVYTPTADDQDRHLRVTATYTDTLGGNKTATRAADAAVTTGVATEFGDIEADGVHTPAIEALAEQGVFADTECGPNLFCPHQPMQRWVMAVWLIRLLTEEPPAIGASRFGDIADGQWWIRYTEQLADLEITVGCTTNPPQYCPQRIRNPRPDGHPPGTRSQTRPSSPRRVHRHRRQHPRRQHRHAIRRRDHRRLRHRPAPLLPQPASHQSTNGFFPPPSPRIPATNLNNQPPHTDCR